MAPGRPGSLVSGHLPMLSSALSGPGGKRPDRPRY